MSARGTTNTNTRGGSDARRRRREWLIETYRADVDILITEGGELVEIERGWGEPACRCYRCGRLLWMGTITVDRIVPAAQGGTYARGNIRPACMTCNARTGVALRESMKRKAVPA